MKICLNNIFPGGVPLRVEKIGREVIPTKKLNKPPFSTFSGIIIATPRSRFSLRPQNHDNDNNIRIMQLLNDQLILTRIYLPCFRDSDVIGIVARIHLVCWAQCISLWVVG